MKYRPWTIVEWRGKEYRILHGLPPERGRPRVTLYQEQTRLFVKAFEDECRRVIDRKETDEGAD